MFVLPLTTLLSPLITVSVEESVEFPLPTISTLLLSLMLLSSPTIVIVSLLESIVLPLPLISILLFIFLTVLWSPISVIFEQSS